jgi:hypothetical protein
MGKRMNWSVALLVVGGVIGASVTGFGAARAPQQELRAIVGQPGVPRPVVAPPPPAPTPVAVAMGSTWK